MEGISSPRNADEGTLFSCWGCLKLKLPWTTRRRTRRYTSATRPTSRGHKHGTGGFRYDPLSYAQNFDEGFDEDDEEYFTQRGFSARYAAPAPLSKSLEDK
ncbi:hypothetical protein FNV43_RR12645 [Rhamnella rubrinervis]|uniref:Uncharacterized protein n=1 Tax=Rhamnella rubrinervis TaxID=2594499 RepID=A0A8K0H893_9ROSA|nr:hypothetical protein FNV43_RR12645 [Rhamnella rubrinervis]